MIGNCSLWFWIVILNFTRCVKWAGSIGLLSITSTCHFSCSSCNGIYWVWAQYWSLNAMPVALQLIIVCVDISWLFTVTMLVITKCFPSIDPSNISTLLTGRCEIPKHLKAFETKPVSHSKSHVRWLTYSFPNSSEPVLVPTSLTSALATLNLWVGFLAAHSAAL